MRGRTPGEAVEAYAEPIRQTLRCVTNSILSYGGGVYPTGRVNTLTFAYDAIAPLYGTKFGLHFSQRYEFLQDSRGHQLWKIQTRGYIYTVYDYSEDDPREIFAYHWHPQQTVTIPHVHFKRGEPHISRTHLPTGRISIESVVEFLIRELGVEPGRKDWHAAISRNRDAFEQNRSWV